MLLSTPKPSYLSGEMNGRQSTRITAISPYRKAATAVHWKVMVPAACGGTGGSGGRLRLPLPPDTRERAVGPGTARGQPGGQSPGQRPRQAAKGPRVPPASSRPPSAAAEPQGRLILPPSFPPSLPPGASEPRQRRCPAELMAARGGSRPSPAGAAEAWARLSRRRRAGEHGLSVRTRCRLRPARGCGPGRGSDTAEAVRSRQPGPGKVRVEREGRVRAGKGSRVQPGPAAPRRPRWARPGGTCPAGSCPGTALLLGNS